MAIHKGTYWTGHFTLKDTSGAVINISGWEFEADLRYAIEDDSAALRLTTANGGFAVLDGPNGRLEMRVSEAQSSSLEEGKILFDVLRTDAVPGPIWLFRAMVPVKLSVTRDV